MHSYTLRPCNKNRTDVIISHEYEPNHFEFRICGPHEYNNVLVCYNYAIKDRHAIDFSVMWNDNS